MNGAILLRCSAALRRGRSRRGKPAFVSSDRTAQQPSAIRPDRTGRRNRLARDRWQALEQALADFAVTALAFEQD
jgi:hypothetical protein